MGAPSSASEEWDSETPNQVSRPKPRGEAPSRDQRAMRKRNEGPVFAFELSPLGATKSMALIFTQPPAIN
jgi:hypothetical protein